MSFVDDTFTARWEIQSKINGNSALREISGAILAVLIMFWVNVIISGV